jgi:two-component system response regulator NreC
MIRIVLADDHAMVRTGLRLILEQQPDMTVVGEAGNGFEAVVAALRLQPAVLVLDIGMPEMDGLDALEHVNGRAPQIRVVMLASTSNDLYVQHALRYGALGYVHKQSSADDFVRTVRMAARGCLAVEWSGSAEPVDALRPGGRCGLGVPPERDLTEREREVLRMVAQGYSNTAIAVRLGIGAKTVDTHRSHVMAKLDIHSRAGLTRYAMQRGYLVAAS